MDACQKISHALKQGIYHFWFAQVDVNQLVVWRLQIGLHGEDSALICDVLKTEQVANDQSIVCFY